MWVQSELRPFGSYRTEEEEDLTANVHDDEEERKPENPEDMVSLLDVEGHMQLRFVRPELQDIHLNPSDDASTETLALNLKKIHSKGYNAMKEREELERPVCRCMRGFSRRCLV